MTGQLIAGFQGQGATISSFLTQTAAVTNTLADRDQLIGQVIDNLNIVLGSLGGQSEQFDKAVTRCRSSSTGWPSARPTSPMRWPTSTPAPASFADLLAAGPAAVQEGGARNRPGRRHRGGRPRLPRRLPQHAARHVPGAEPARLYGDFFSFYLCDAVLKLNGKGGQPVYVKVAGQNTGRCAPK